MKDHQSSLAAWNPIRPQLLLAYARLLPRWSHPFLDPLDP